MVNTSAALQDDEYSRSVCDTALAAVVPAWVAAGHGSAALWAEAAAALPALPPHRRLDLLLALLRALPKVCSCVAAIDEECAVIVCAAGAARGVMHLA